MTISQLAATGNVGVETVRFYQRKGLMETPRPCKGIRRYNQSHVQRLTFIRTAQQAGFTLNEIHELLSLDVHHDHQRAQQLANERIAELDIKIIHMQKARALLKRLADQCSSHPEAPCAILEAFNH